MTPKAWIHATNIISPLGLTTDDTFRAVRQGQSGLAPHRFYFAEDPLWISAIDNTVLNEAFSRLADPARYSRLEQMSILSVHDALARSNFRVGARTGFIYCTTKGNIEHLPALVAEKQTHSVGTYPDRTHPGPSRPDLFLAGLARNVAGFFGIQAVPVVVSNACISGLQGLIVAQRLLDTGLYDEIIVTGGDVMSAFTLSGFKSFNALSDTRCRPFDANRKGTNLGEAAATVILSRRQPDTEAVGLLGGHTTNDATHISAPSRTGEGLYQAIRRTLAPLTAPENVDFVSAHGTATRYNDDMEAHALYRTGLSERPVHSLKGYFGHTLGAAGLLESIIATQSLLHNVLIASKGYEQPGTTHPLRVTTQNRVQLLRCALKTSSGFGGCNAAALFIKAA